MNKSLEAAQGLIRRLAYVAVAFLFLMVLLIGGLFYLFIKADGCGLSAAYMELITLLP